MCIRSREKSASQCGAGGTVGKVLIGTLLVTGVVALVWALLARRHGELLDPLLEADRRINELEESLRHLQGTIKHTVR